MRLEHAEALAAAGRDAGVEIEVLESVVLDGGERTCGVACRRFGDFAAAAVLAGREADEEAALALARGLEDTEYDERNEGIVVF